MIQSFQIAVPKTAHYYAMQADVLQQEIWLLFHGYGQSAEHFLQHFRHFDKVNALRIAPEGHSRFYLKGFDGRVGASWMTREKREFEIKDQHHFIDQLIQHLDPNKEYKLNLLGFSQGAAVACRWYQHTDRKVQNLVVWGAGLPIETDDRMAEKYNACRLIFMLGNQDPFLTEEKQNEFYATLNKLQFRHLVIKYEGAHNIDKNVLEELKLALNSKI